MRVGDDEKEQKKRRWEGGLSRYTVSLLSFKGNVQHAKNAACRLVPVPETHSLHVTFLSASSTIGIPY